MKKNRLIFAGAFAVVLIFWASGVLSRNSVALGRAAQASERALPKGVHSDSRNRLPVVKRETLDDLGKSIYDETAGDVRAGAALAGFQGPGGINLYSPGVANADRSKIRYLRSDGRLGRRMYELAVLVTARELDHQFIWTAHEAAAVRAGVAAEVIEIIKNRQSIANLQPKDAIVIQLGRELFTRRSVELSTFTRALSLFGEQGLVDVVSVMAQYASAAVLLNAFDQQLAEGQQPLLPLR